MGERKDIKPRLYLLNWALDPGVVFHPQRQDNVRSGALAARITANTLVRHAHQSVNSGGVIPLRHCPICALRVSTSGEKPLGIPINLDKGANLLGALSSLGQSLPKKE